MIDDVLERVRKHVIEEGDCWEWQAALQTCGTTPVMRYQQRTISVRRLILEAKGTNLEGKFATHKCGNELCVNPSHVIAVTRKALQKRAAPKLKRHVNPARAAEIARKARERAKLTPEMVEEIRSASGTQREIAKQYGIWQSTVSCIKRGITWRDYANPFAALLLKVTK